MKNVKNKKNTKNSKTVSSLLIAGIIIAVAAIIVASIMLLSDKNKSNDNKKDDKKTTEQKNDKKDEGEEEKVETPDYILELVGYANAANGESKDKEKNVLDEIPDASESDDPHSITAFKSKNFTVNNSMLKYYFLFDYYEAITKVYESYLQYYNLDPAVDLKEQECSMFQQSGGGTWFDYFMGNTCNNVMYYLLYSEVAKGYGNENDPAIQKAVEHDMADLVSSATDFEHVSVEEFISNHFGETVTEDDIRDALTLYYTGTAQYDRDVNVLKEHMNDEVLEKHFEANKKDYLFCDFRSYSFKPDVPEGASEQDKAAIYAENEKLAQQLLATGKKEAFVEWIRNYETENNGSFDESYTEDEINYHATKVTGEYAYNDKTAFGKWAFVDGRKEGDMTVLDNGQGTYTVYYIERAPYRRDYNTVNFRRILVDMEDFENDAEKTQKKANELWAKWEASDRSEEAFNALAAEYDSTDTVYFEEQGLGDLEAELGAWCYKEGRKPGDNAMVRSEYGYYLVYFCGTGREQWKINAYDDVMTLAINELYTEYINRYSTVMNKNNVYLISGKTAFTENK